MDVEGGSSLGRYLEHKRICIRRNGRSKYIQCVKGACILMSTAGHHVIYHQR